MDIEATVGGGIEDAGGYEQAERNCDNKVRCVWCWWRPRSEGVDLVNWNGQRLGDGFDGYWWGLAMTWIPYG